MKFQFKVKEVSHPNTDGHCSAVLVPNITEKVSYFDGDGKEITQKQFEKLRDEFSKGSDVKQPSAKSEKQFNSDFWKQHPGGRIELYIDDQKKAEQFQPGKVVKVSFEF